MKKLILAFILFGFQFSTALAQGELTIGMVVNSCTVVSKKNSITYKELNSCLKNKIIRSFLNLKDEARIVLSVKSKNNQNVLLGLDWQPLIQGRLASLSEVFIWATEYPREMWLDIINKQNDDIFHALKFKSVFGKMTATIEQGFSFKDILYNEIVSEVFRDVQSIEISIFVVGMKNKRLQYKGDISINSQENELKFEIKTDNNPIRQRPFYLDMIGSEVKEMSEVIP